MIAHPNSPWTPEKTAELVRLWAEGMSTVAIGLALGLNKNQVIGRAHRIGVPKRTSPIKHRVIALNLAVTPYSMPVKNGPPKAARPMLVTPRPKRPPRIDGNSGHYTATGETTCRMIRNDDLREPDYCPRPRLPGKAWCREDYQRVYRPAPPK